MVELALALGAEPRRDRACAVLRLGAEEPRRADADARAGRARGRDGRGAARDAITAGSSSTPSCPTITRASRSPASAAGAGARSTSRRRARCCPATPPKSIPGLEFWIVREHSLADIWANSPAFNAFRGTDWMQEPCASCDAARDRFRRLPLPGLRADRRRPRDRSRSAISRPHHDRVAELAAAAGRVLSYRRNNAYRRKAVTPRMRVGGRNCPDTSRARTDVKPDVTAPAPEIPATGRNRTLRPRSRPHRPGGVHVPISNVGSSERRIMKLAGREAGCCGDFGFAIAARRRRAAAAAAASARWTRPRPPRATRTMNLKPHPTPPIAPAADKLPVDKIKLPAGFKAEVCRSGHPGARTMVQGRQGHDVHGHAA